LVNPSTTKIEFGKVFFARLSALAGSGQQNELAQTIGVSPGMITKYKKGAAPGADVVAIAAAKFGVTTDYLLGIELSSPGMALREIPAAHEVDDLLQKVDDLLEQAASIKRTAQRLKKK
jgi:transcriptional regulator with XRE-family HTH domain